jgi:hypothetical protein
MATQSRGHATLPKLASVASAPGGMPTALGGHANRQEPDMATQSRGHATLKHM